MSISDIEQDFPLLGPDNYEAVSDEDINYNCLAFALGDTHNWWEPTAMFGYYWPPGFPADVSVETVKKIIRLHGYVVEVDKNTRPSTEAIAIYAKNHEWEHFAKYTNGRWVSKLGDGHDISHATLGALEGDYYGEVVLVLSREKT